MRIYFKWWDLLLISDLNYIFNIVLSLRSGLNSMYICFVKREFYFFYKIVWKRDYFIRDRYIMVFVFFVDC